MAHPYSGHSQNAVGRRRVKVVMKSGGYASGGKASHGPDCTCSSCRSTGGRANANGFADGGTVQGDVAPARLDKRAAGGGVRKITPSKHKPHLNVNIVNVSRPRRGLAPPPAPGIPAIGGAPALPAMPLKPPGMAKGGKITRGKMGKLWGGAPYGGAANGLGRLGLTRKTKRDNP